jgi:hypothetical protein
MLRWMRETFASGVGLVAVAACGPSFQVVYEGDARFEHCYALDETQSVSLQEKSDCWTQWLRSHTYGQTRNRIDYAAMRAKALRDAPVTPTDEAVMSAAPGGGVGRPVGQDEPVTTNAFATPPKTMGEVEAAREAGAPEKAGSEPPAAMSRAVTSPAPETTPAEACTDRCRAAWQRCRPKCKAGACRVCDDTYGRCMKRCF